jgi:hypothetical protein
LPCASDLRQSEDEAAAVTKVRLSAFRLPLTVEGEEKTKAHLARRRENAGAWLFEM